MSGSGKANPSDQASTRPTVPAQSGKRGISKAWAKVEPEVLESERLMLAGIEQMHAQQEADARAKEVSSLAQRWMAQVVKFNADLSTPEPRFPRYDDKQMPGQMELPGMDDWLYEQADRHFKG